MKLVRWSFMGLYMPMMENAEDGNLYCTTHQLAEALKTDKDSLFKIRQRHSDEFSSRLWTNCPQREFLKEYKAEFGIKQIKKNVMLWSEEDMVLVAILSKTPVSTEFRKNLSRFIKENAVRDLIHISVLEATRSQMLEDRSVMMEELDRQRGRLDSLQQVIDRFIPASDRAASAAGQMLQARQHALRVIEGGVH